MGFASPTQPPIELLGPTLAPTSPGPRARRSAAVLATSLRTLPRVLVAGNASRRSLVTPIGES